MLTEKLANDVALAVENKMSQKTAMTADALKKLGLYGLAGIGGATTMGVAASGLGNTYGSIDYPIENAEYVNEVLGDRVRGTNSAIGALDRLNRIKPTMEGINSYPREMLSKDFNRLVDAGSKLQPYM